MNQTIKHKNIGKYSIIPKAAKPLSPISFNPKYNSTIVWKVKSRRNSMSENSLINDAVFSSKKKDVTMAIRYKSNIKGKITGLKITSNKNNSLPINENPKK